MARLRTLTISIAATAVATGGIALGGLSNASAARHTPHSSAHHGAKISTRHDDDLGTYLVGPNGHALYLFEKDHGSKSHCSGTCAGVWPPLLTSGKPSAAGKAKAGKLGTTKRKDGSKQVTYHGHPLYYYEPDNSKKDTSGEGLEEFGAEWYVVNPKGHKVDDDGDDDGDHDGGDDHGGGHHDG